MASSKDIIMDEIEIKILEAEMRGDTAIKHLKMLIQERDAIAKDFDQLEGLIHPIRRAPDDILQYIFEWVFWTTEAPGWIQPVSQVCRQWRSIAINTPLLWSYINPPFRSNSAELSKYWKVATERIKATPANIVLWVDSIHPPLFDVLSYCPLGPIQSIASLTIWLNNYILKFMPLWTAAQSKTVGSLTINNHFTGWNKPLSLKVISDMVFPWKPTTIQLMSDFKVFTLATHNTLSTVQRLSISVQDHNSNLHNLFQVFPSLESLRLDHWTLIKSSHPQTITLRHLRRLEVLSRGFPWGLKLQCPRLEHLDIDLSETKITPDICEFISNNHSIQVIVCLVEEYSDETISSVALELEDLLLATNTSQDGTPRLLALHVELEEGSDGEVLDSRPQLKGRSWSFVTKENNRRFREYLWK